MRVRGAGAAGGGAARLVDTACALAAAVATAAWALFVTLVPLLALPAGVFVVAAEVLPAFGALRLEPA